VNPSQATWRERGFRGLAWRVKCLCQQVTISVPPSLVAGDVNLADELIGSQSPSLGQAREFEARLEANLALFKLFKASRCPSEICRLVSSGLISLEASSLSVVCYRRQQEMGVRGKINEKSLGRQDVFSMTKWLVSLNFLVFESVDFYPGRRQIRRWSLFSSIHSESCFAWIRRCPDTRAHTSDVSSG
jgi:hypothetical protein